MGTDGVTLTGALARVAGSDVGSYAINQGALAISSGSNYSIQYTSANYAITARPIIITANLAQNKVYGELDGLLSYTLEANSLGRGWVAGDQFSGAIARAVGEDVATNYAINQGTLANNNYTITFVAANFSISRRPVYVLANAGQTKVYGETDPILTYTVAAKATGAGLLGTDGITLTGNIARATGEDVGDYAINQGTLATSAGANYNIQFTPENFSITQLALVVVADKTPTINLSANRATKIYGDVDPLLSVSLGDGSRLVGGDNLTDVTGIITRVAGENVGNYDVLLGRGSKTANYNIAYNSSNGAFTISQRAITLAPIIGNKVQGSTDPILGVNLIAGSLALTDSINEVVGEISRTPGEAAAVYDVLLGRGEKASNYQVTFDNNNGAFLIKPSVELPVAGVILTNVDEAVKRKNGGGRSGRRSAGGKCLP